MRHVPTTNNRKYIFHWCWNRRCKNILKPVQHIPTNFFKHYWKHLTRDSWMQNNCTGPNRLAIGKNGRAPEEPKHGSINNAWKWACTKETLLMHTRGAIGIESKVCSDRLVITILAVSRVSSRSTACRCQMTARQSTQKSSNARGAGPLIHIDKWQSLCS